MESSKQDWELFLPFQAFYPLFLIYTIKVKLGIIPMSQENF